MKSLLTILSENVSTNLGDGKWKFQGKVGEWKTAANGDHMFFPDDGSPPMGARNTLVNSDHSALDTKQRKKIKEHLSDAAASIQAKLKELGKDNFKKHATVVAAMGVVGLGVGAALLTGPAAPVVAAAAGMASAISGIFTKKMMEADESSFEDKIASINPDLSKGEAKFLQQFVKDGKLDDEAMQEFLYQLAKEMSKQLGASYPSNENVHPGGQAFCRKSSFSPKIR